ncbi:MAG: hypothetical protein A2788_01645 [Candidatus Abawacabacteria bacterium RIFCSPHIGHO2_01_FULL_46_8]|uniref:Uncharacterized protein n=1 Tax=Candidatus Abawacabacteria bacterium RIFCSPHIGHO2_01_FULL_46_8 TaxID=1817815 RepID=A0A1F4XLZ0_9BACT|nr:MAG: hypothetical protein A2788_01645 [Candidatus Abawacabacteria bacterium RIFCSPHIGHO2_01_FULL_46_8]
MNTNFIQFFRNFFHHNLWRLRNIFWTPNFSWEKWQKTHRFSLPAFKTVPVRLNEQRCKRRLK